MRFASLLVLALALPPPAFAAGKPTEGFLLPAEGLTFEADRPSYKFVTDPDTGFYRTADLKDAIVVNGQTLPFAVPAAPSTIGGKLLELITTPAGLGTIGTLIMGALGLLLGSNEIRRRRVALAVYHAFHIVEDIGAEIPGDDAFDKVGRGLKAIDDYLVANGWRPLKPGEKEIAKLGFQSLNGASKLAEKIAANAAGEGGLTPLQEALDQAAVASAREKAKADGLLAERPQSP